MTRLHVPNFSWANTGYILPGKRLTIKIDVISHHYSSQLTTQMLMLNGKLAKNI